MAGISLFMLKQGSRNNYNNARKDPRLLENYHTIFDKRLPHLDSTDQYFRGLPEEELEKIKVTPLSISFPALVLRPLKIIISVCRSPILLTNWLKPARPLIL
jgi:hypothetical protein